MRNRTQCRRELRALIKTLTQVELTEEQLSLRVVQIVQDAEAGELDHHDSLILGEYAVSTLRDCL